MCLLPITEVHFTVGERRPAECHHIACIVSPMAVVPLDVLFFRHSCGYVHFACIVSPMPVAPLDVLFFRHSRGYVHFQISASCLHGSYALEGDIQVCGVWYSVQPVLQWYRPDAGTGEEGGVTGEVCRPKGLA